MNVAQGYKEKSRLGRLLVNRGYLSEDELEQGLRLQRETGQRLGEALIQAGWLSERELKRVLRQQTRYRHAVAFAAMVSLPFQPMVSFASTTTSSAERVDDAGEIYQRNGSFTPLSDEELSGAAGQGGEQFLATLASVGGTAKTAEEDRRTGRAVSTDSLEGLNLVANTFVPLLSFLDSDVTVSGVHYSADRPRFQLLDNGRLRLALPERIEQIRMDNIRVSGGHTPSMGNVTLSDIRFEAGSSMTVYAR
ncbi:pilus assembly protein PilB [Marinobacter sp.]|uniref:pilus assembly protein PilB n=1 Tax=Marinobacter sp. TaxID=50741 RepID=UPI0038510851